MWVGSLGATRHLKAHYIILRTFTYHAQVQPITLCKLVHVCVCVSECFGKTNFKTKTLIN